MVSFHCLKIQELPLFRVILLLFFTFILCLDLWAAQEAIVVADKAIIYSDKEMTSPIGYVLRGKKIAVGDIARNMAQVYPVVVSGKVAYIRVVDVSTEKDSAGDGSLATERFTRASEKLPETKYVLSYITYRSRINLSAQNDQIQNNDVLNWNGVSLKGEAFLKKSFDLQIFVNYLTLDQGREQFRMTEFGPGVAFRLVDKKSFLLRWESQLIVIPFTTYAINGQFRKRSYGSGIGTGLNATFLWSKHWGIEGSFGYYYNRLARFDLPDPYRDIAPSFMGVRASVGINYTY